jgi:Xaa-Pro dipeptidase
MARGEIDERALVEGRARRVREALAAGDLAAAVLLTRSISATPREARTCRFGRCTTRPATHSSPRLARRCLFEFHGCAHLARGLDTIGEVREACTWSYFGAGPRVEEKAKRWAAEIADLVCAHGGGNRRLAVDRLDPAGTWALQALGVTLSDGQAAMEGARAIKSADEIAAIAACEEGMSRMREAMRPGITENELWSVLHQTNIARGGEWIETCLLASGPRSNPWFHECGDRAIEAGDLVSFDTDLIGPRGYCADISRTWRCGAGKPSNAQRRLYAHAQLHRNIELLRPGVGFRELAEKGWPMPPEYLPNRYSVLAHGVGMCDEYPMYRTCKTSTKAATREPSARA